LIQDQHFRQSLLRHCLDSVDALANKLRRLINQEFKDQVIIENGYQTVENYEPNAIYLSFRHMLLG
jgi:hypothetical protein